MQLTFWYLTGSSNESTSSVNDSLCTGSRPRVPTADLAAPRNGVTAHQVSLRRRRRYSSKAHSRKVTQELVKGPYFIKPRKLEPILRLAQYNELYSRKKMNGKLFGVTTVEDDADGAAWIRETCSHVSGNDHSFVGTDWSQADTLILGQSSK